MRLATVRDLALGVNAGNKLYQKKKEKIEAILTSRLEEIESGEATLRKLKSSYEALLDTPIADLELDGLIY